MTQNDAADLQIRRIVFLKVVGESNMLVMVELPRSYVEVD